MSSGCAEIGTLSGLPGQRTGHKIFESIVVAAAGRLMRSIGSAAVPEDLPPSSGGYRSTRGVESTEQRTRAAFRVSAASGDAGMLGSDHIRSAAEWSMDQLGAAGHAV